MIWHRDDALMDRARLTLIEHCLDFSLRSQPVCGWITAIEAPVFCMKIGSNSNLFVTLGSLMLELLGCFVSMRCGSLLMQSFCFVYGMRHDVPPLEISWVSRSD